MVKAQSESRLDRMLATEHKGFSRSFFQKLIKERGVKVNGTTTKKPHFVLRAADTVSLSPDDVKAWMKQTEVEEPDGEREELKQAIVIFKGKQFFVIDKPSFISTEALTKGFFPVHRLDKDTSGVLMIAHDAVTKATLQKQWLTKKVQKTYITLVKGRLTPPKGSIDAGIFRSMKDRRKMAVSRDNRARGAITHYEVLEYIDSPSLKQKFTLLMVFPATGRTHQIRVHFASIGFSVVGDTLYGDRKMNKKIEQKCGLKRQFLHAQALKLINPETKKEQTFTSKLPQELIDVANCLKT